MKTLIQSAAIFLLASAAVQAQTVVIADNYDSTGSGTGFGLGAGINSGINPPDASRLTGTAAPGLSYLYTQPTQPVGTQFKAVTKYSITGNKAKIAAGSYAGRYSMSADGSTPFNFGTALGATSATAAAPIIYDVTISMANSLSGTQKFSLGLSTTEGPVDALDFGIQLYRAAAADTTYQIARRLDTASTGILDVNASMASTEAYGSELNFRMRFTDAGAETDANYNSRVQLFLEDTLIYDTATDSTLVNGWRFDSADRFFVWDQAGAASTTGAVTYDNFSVTLVPEPSVMALGLVAGAAMLLRRRR